MFYIQLVYQKHNINEKTTNTNRERTDYKWIQ